MAAIVTVLLLASTAGLAATDHVAGSISGQSSGAATGAQPARSAGPDKVTAPAQRSSTLPSATALSSSSTLPYGLSEVDQEIAAGKVNRNAALLPRAPSGAIPKPGAQISGPSYPGLPAPMGLSDLGQGSNGPYEYNTSSFAATLSLSSFQDYNPGYSAWEASPDWMTFQLNTVTVNVSYPGATNGSFWIQNVVHFNGTTLQFENNIWNFSSPAACLGVGTLLNYSGQQDGCFYYVYGPTYQVSYPLTLTLYNNITISNWGPSPVPDVFFNYSLTDPSGTFVGSFDNVTFNGLASPSAPPEFEVNGFNYAPIGYLFWDAEIIFGGNGGGANANIVELESTAQLQYWNSTTDAYANVPSAYDYGEDTGETSLGVAASYTGATETLVQGPSQLYGLWNTTAGLFGPAALPGSIDLTITGAPVTGFAFVTNETEYAASGDENASYWPALANGTLYTELPPVSGGNGYVAEILANGFDTLVTAPLTTSGTTPVVLSPDPTVFDTPVYLNNDSWAQDYGSYGLTGVSYAAGNLTIDDTQSSVATPFNLVNDFIYPTFVLFAALNLSVNVSIDNFAMSASSFVYHGTRGVATIPGWSQGYYFNFGSGIFDVSNVDIIGNSTLYYEGSEPISAVEFWVTNGENASNIVTSQDNFGVDAFYSNDVSFFNITSETGANAAVAYYADDVTAVDITANGTDYPGPYFGLPSYGLILQDVDDVLVDGLTASNDGLGLYSLYVEGFTFENIVASDPDNIISPDSGYAAPAVYLYETGYGELYGMTVNDALGIEGEEFGYFLFDNLSFVNGAVAGELYYSSGTAYEQITVANSDGLDVYYADDAQVQWVNASGLDSEMNPATGIVIEEASEVSAYNISATNQAEGAIIEGATNVSAGGIAASDEAYGLLVGDAVNVSVADVTASDSAIGTVSGDNENVTVDNVTVSGIGVGVGVGDSENVSIDGVTQTATTAGPLYFSTPYAGVIPNAPVATYDDLGVEVSNISAYDTGFAVLDNGTEDLSIAAVTEWYAGIGISLNGTEEVTVSTAFLYGSQTGVLLNDTSFAEVTASTIEGSHGYGVWIAYGDIVVITANNFVANNGASTDGVYSSAHIQAGVLSSTAVAFDLSDVGNYWSDWVATSGPYVIATGVEDSSPVSAFISNWLEFAATGLPAGTQWGFTLGSTDYTTFAALVFIPAWSLGDPSLAYVVQAPAGYTPTPASGSVDFTGANDTVTIAFAAIPYTVTFTESGLPAGTSWSVTFNGTLESNTTSASGGSIVFQDVIDGVYSYTVGTVANYSSTGSGTVTVDGSNVQKTITFSLVTYSATFTETGLTAGTTWSVTIGTQTVQSTTSTITFALANGTYTYTVGTVSGYTASPTTGSITVTPAGVSTPITFTAVPVTTYTVTFTESGLTSGSTWSVTLNGVTKSASAGSSIVFTGLSNGSLSYSIAAVSGYTASPSSGTVTVNGADQTVTVTFSSSTSPSSSSGLSTLDWAIIGIVIVLIIVGLVVALARRGRTPPSQQQSGPSDGEQPPADGSS